ncbi:MAG TPA: deoxyguanosinetriphosphate triphosphohydrolase [Acidobacteriota bacterium]|nr:deoxyguanosinetriphosphate triphosphohydrolase [Acidobacteriota bacterium]
MMTVGTYNRALASYAFAEELSRGRRYSEPAHPYRSDYQRDRDRVIHTKAFRRLENKTQVFGPDYSDHFRNRLTHTLEVSQIARTISQVLGLNTDLCEALALSHDIGHPPFSHEGEGVLNALMKSYGSGFDHNLHALTIVEDFESRYASFRGLNLTFEVREGIVKHSRDYDGSENLWVDVSPYLIGLRPPLESQVIDVADEIAYNAADLDDGYESGLLPLPEILRGSELFAQLYSENSRRFADASEKLRMRETQRRLIDHLVTSLVEATKGRLRRLKINSVDAVRRYPRRLVGFDEENSRLNHEIKTLLRRGLYNHPSLAPVRREARSKVERLFHFYMQDPSRLPEHHYRRVRRDRIAVHTAVCHYIAGMTDLYAEKMCRGMTSSP